MNGRCRGVLVLLLFAMPASQALAAKHDFDGDGRDDLVWRNTVTGADALWLSADASSGRLLASVKSQRWTIVGAGDFDGDGRADLLWRQRSSGANAIWRSGDFASPRVVAPVADLDWSVAGIGDFDGDARSDVLWRNLRTGGNIVWRGADSATARGLARMSVDAAVSGIGDLDGDGRDDVVWRDLRTGAVTLWPGADAARSRALTTVPDRNWQLAAVGDFDGDAHADLFWRNAWDGRNLVWPSGDSATRIAMTRVESASWQIAGVGDYDGDGRADLLWRQFALGSDLVWPSANAAAAHTMRTVDTAWTVEPFEGQPTFPTIEAVGGDFIEGNGGLSIGGLTLRLSHPSVVPVRASVGYWDSGGHTYADPRIDFGSPYYGGGEIALAPGETTALVPLRIIGDTAPEANEIVNLSWWSPDALQVNQDFPYVRIVNDDTNTLWCDNVQRWERDAGLHRWDFTLHLSRPSPWTVEFDVETVGRTLGFSATPDVDYIDTHAHVVFPPGTVTATFSVGVYGDKVREPLGESFAVVIESPIGAVVAPGVATGHILDNEAPIIP